MGARYLLDTNICIYIRRHRPPTAVARFRELKRGEAILSVITYGEVLCGAHKSRDRAHALTLLEELAEMIPVKPLPLEAGLAYGAVRSALEARGEIIGNNDLWIAAHAVAAGLILVANNEREFGRIEALKLQNWAG